MDTNVDERIEMIMRQTDYSREIAQQKLLDHQNDVTLVIREYMAPAIKPQQVCINKLSSNQQIYKEIRSMMDDASKNYELKKHQQQQHQRQLQQHQQQQQQQQQPPSL
jgi:hypothetical protein